MPIINQFNKNIFFCYKHKKVRYYNIKERNECEVEINKINVNVIIYKYKETVVVLQNNTYIRMTEKYKVFLRFQLQYEIN